MDVVIDASALIAVAANEAQKNDLIRLTTGVDLIAPASVHFEIGNAISAMLKRRRITIEQAAQLLEQYQLIPLRFVDVELGESILIAQRYNIYAYDAYLIRCAEKYRCPLLTLDEGLRHHAQTHAVTVLEVAQ
jgi:predicted nucleic acid-binding protein